MIKELFINGLANKEAYVEGHIPTFRAASEVQAWRATPSEVSVSPASIIVNYVLYMIDLVDKSSAHDGAAVVVSSDGVRYKSVVSSNIFAIESRTIATPPALSSAAAGAAWIVPAAPSGAWANYPNKIAIASGSLWSYTTPKVGQIFYVKPENTFVFYDGAGFTSGLGSPSGGTVKSAALENPFGISVANTLAAPPTITAASPRKYYVIAPSATGAWIGKDGQIAFNDGAAWQFIAAYEGAEVYSEALKYRLKFVGGAWVKAVDNVIVNLVSAEAEANFTISAAGVDDTACQIAYAPKKVGNKLRIKYACNTDIDGQLSLRLFTAGSATHLKSLPFYKGRAIFEVIITTDSLVSKTYFIKAGGTTSTGAAVINLRSMSIEEISV